MLECVDLGGSNNKRLCGKGLTERTIVHERVELRDDNKSVCRKRLTMNDLHEREQPCWSLLTIQTKDNWAHRK